MPYCHVHIICTWTSEISRSGADWFDRAWDVISEYKNDIPKRRIATGTKINISPVRTSGYIPTVRGFAGRRPVALSAFGGGGRAVLNVGGGAFSAGVAHTVRRRGDVREPRSIWPRSRGTNYGGPPILLRRDRPRVNIIIYPSVHRVPFTLGAPPDPPSCRRRIAPFGLRRARREWPRACARLIVVQLILLCFNFRIAPVIVRAGTSEYTVPSAIMTRNHRVGEGGRGTACFGEEVPFEYSATVQIL